MNAKSLVAAILGAAAVLATGFARAADIKVLASNGVKAALEELAPAFERETGNKLVISFGLAAALKRQIESGEAFDVAILTTPGSRICEAGQGGRRFARVPGALGVASASGKADRVPTSARPTPSAHAASTKSISWAKEGQSGIYFAACSSASASPSR